MNEHYRCGDRETLLAYVYGEREAGDYEDLGVHLSECASCAEEVAALRSTREALAAWTPPETALGFRIARTSEAAPAAVVRPPAWWRQPLPAWAQAAAAVLIFAAGVAFGGAGQPPVVDTAAVGDAAAATPAPVVATGTSSIAREELALLEQRLNVLETTPRPEPRLAAASGLDEAALLERVEAMIEASEQRQRLQNTRLAQAVDVVAENIEIQRRADLQRMERRIGQVVVPTEEMLRQQSQVFSMLASYPSTAGR